MKKVLSYFLLLSMLLLSGCAKKILIRPAIDNVKKIAIVSIYMNRDLYNIKSPKALQGENTFARLAKGLVKGALQKVITKGERERNQIITYGAKVYAKQLRSIENWQVISLKKVIINDAYKNLMSPDTGKGIKFFQKTEGSYWIKPKGMHHIPVSSVVQSGKRIYAGSAKDPTEDARKVMAKLCKSLGVDGVALVELDLGYRFGKVAKVTMFGKTSAKPTISSSVVVVTSDGSIAVNTGLIVKGQGTRYEGKSVKMVEKDYPFFQHKDNKIVNSFNIAVEKSAVGMKKKLDKAFKSLSK